MGSAYVSAKDIRTIQEMLSGLDAEFSHLRAAVESHQAKVRMILLSYERDNGGADAKTGQRGCP